MQQELVKVRGMHCGGCEQAIERAVAAWSGVRRVKASQARGQVAIEFDPALVRFEQLLRAIENKGYAVGNEDASSGWRRLLAFLILLAGVGGIALWGKSQTPGLLAQLPAARMDYLALLGIGFLSGFHCIGMCGGFVVGYTVTDPRRSPRHAALAHLAYGAGKTASYAALGALFGALGGLITVTPMLRGALSIGAGLFLVLFGLKLLDAFGALRRLGLPLPTAWSRAVGAGLRENRNPLVVGLLSGLLLGCGPLQAAYVMALGSGDAVAGAAMLACFGLGTLPPLLGFGLFAGLLRPGRMQDLVRVSGILVLLMGLMMTDRGLKLTQSGYDFASPRHRVMEDAPRPLQPDGG